MPRNVAITLTLSLVLAACGGGKTAAPKPTGSKVTSTAKSNQSAIKSQKPAAAMKTTTAPKAIPAAKTAGSTTVKAPDLTSGGRELETWAFTDVDLDGDGAGESGVVLADDSNLLAWFTGAVDSDGTTVTYEALVWLVPQGVGFVFDFGANGVLACGESASGSSGCVACSGSDCQEVGLESSGQQK